MSRSSTSPPMRGTTFALPAGDVWMDGDTAYWFVRLRYRESDIGRNRRQRQFLWALRDQVTKTNLLAHFPDLYGAFQSTFTTDMLCDGDAGPVELGHQPGCGQCACRRLEPVRSAELHHARRGAWCCASPIRHVCEQWSKASGRRRPWWTPTVRMSLDVRRCRPASILSRRVRPNLSETDPDQTGGPPPEVAPPVAAPPEARA